MKYLLFVFTICISSGIIAQEDQPLENNRLNYDINYDEDEEIEDVIYEEAEEDYEVDQAFYIVEEMPVFPECIEVPREERESCTQEKMLNFIQQNIVYPDLAKENGFQGRVFVQFVINKEGEVEDVDVLKGIYKSLDDEAVRVVNSLPKFQPGKQRGKLVKVKYTVPIKFSL